MMQAVLLSDKQRVLALQVKPMHRLAHIIYPAVCCLAVVQKVSVSVDSRHGHLATAKLLLSRLFIAAVAAVAMPC